MSFRLVDHGYPFKKIMQGRSWIGRVGRHLNGGYLGTIGSLTVQGTSERDAFEQVVAKHLGYPDAAALHRKNKVVRMQRRASRNQARHVLDQIMHGNFKPLDEMFKRIEEQ